jgi:hypothetical protein
MCCTPGRATNRGFASQEPASGDVDLYPRLLIEYLQRIERPEEMSRHYAEAVIHAGPRLTKHDRSLATVRSASMVEAWVCQVTHRRQTTGPRARQRYDQRPSAGAMYSNVSAIAANRSAMPSISTGSVFGEAKVTTVTRVSPGTGISHWNTAASTTTPED